MQYVRQYEQEQTQYYNEENISITLYNRDLWNQFHEITNEMIVTKVGRRMFPIISINVRGLDPDKMYIIELSFDQIDSHRWRFVSSQWQAGMKPDPVVNRSPYQHPDSPNYGRYWMKDVITFPKVKLTNKTDHTNSSRVILNSLHKYRPKISIIDVTSKRKIYEATFVETEFIAVTAYQNEEVKSLKIRNNPFAKAFLSPNKMKREIKDEEDERSNTPMFRSQASTSGGGPDRIKLESYRSSPYTYSQSQRKTSPTNVPPYPSSSTSPFDYPTFYPPTSSANNPCSSSVLPDNSIYYSNSYYSTPSSYYYPYGTPTSIPQYPFMPSFTYPLNNNSEFDTSSLLHMQTPTTDSHYSTPLLPITNDIEEY